MREVEEILGYVPESIRGVLRIRELDIREDKRCVSASIEFGPELLDAYGYIHGSVLMVLDIVLSELAAKLAISEDEYLIVVNTSINFIKQPEVFGNLETEACVINRTDRLILVSSITRCEGVDIARANTLFIAEKLS